VIPRIDNRTGVLILQHVGERSHAFNTARIVRTALQNCLLIAAHNQRFGAHDLPIEAGAGLLFPTEHAPTLTELAPADRPSQLVIIDGTWHQAKTIVRDVPQLQALRCFRLAPSSPGQYRIRREPDAHSLSTLEATVAALRSLEPETAGFDQLLSAFNTMVENQLGQLARHAVSRERKKRQSRPRNLPFTLLQDASRLVVAYGEATPSSSGTRSGDVPPVNWVAHRLGTSERFSCHLRQESSLDNTALGHMRLSATDLATAVSLEEFRDRWHQFFGPMDTLVVYHPRTSRLLSTIEAAPPRYLALKSIFGNWRSGVHSMEELMAIEGLPLPSCEGQSRADQRLAMAVAMVEHLRTHYGNKQPCLLGM